MRNIIKFYLNQSSVFLLTVLGIYTIFNIINLMLGIIFEGVFHESAVLSTFITGIIIFIHLIKINMYDTGKETFTIVSMTEYPISKILLSKLIVNFIVTLLFSTIATAFTSLEFFLYNVNLNMLVFPIIIIRTLLIFLILTSYISYPIIWVKSFRNRKKSRKIVALAIIFIWVIINGILKNNVEIFYSNTAGYTRHLGQGTFSIWTILWHLMCCAVFFMFTVHLQKKKIDLI